MPEPNTPWYAWSGTSTATRPADYVTAWKRVRKVVQGAAASAIKLLWAPYVRSIPDTPENAIAAYFPGAAQVDLVGDERLQLRHRRRPGLDRAGAPCSRTPTARSRRWPPSRSGSPRPARSPRAATSAGGSARSATLRTVDPQARRRRLVRRHATERRLPPRARSKATRSAFKALRRGGPGPSEPAASRARRRAAARCAGPRAGGAQAAADRARWSTACCGAPASAPREPTAALEGQDRCTRPSTGCWPGPQGAMLGPPPGRATAAAGPDASTTPTSCWRWCDRMVAHAQPARRAADVLLAPPLGQLARRGLAAAAADHPERAVPPLRGLRRQPHRRRSATWPTRSARARRCCASSPASTTPRRAINENYARELMELFGLGVTDAAGQPNYSEDDVARGRARRLGLADRRRRTRTPRRPTSRRSRWYDGPKIVLGKIGDFGHRELVDLVLGPPEPRAVPGDQAVGRVHRHGRRTRRRCATSSRVYTGGGFQLQAAAAKILTHPRDVRLDRRAEHDQAADRATRSATMRALGVGITDDSARTTPSRDGPGPVLPADGGGLGGRPAWLNTNTALARFALANRLLTLSYATLPAKAPEDVPARRPAPAFDRAHAAVGAPVAGRRARISSLRDYATHARARPRPTTASRASSCCARSCSAAPTHR